MRLWSLHPKYLDAKGLVALWREALLAKHVLEGKTKGYKNHPQLARFKAAKDPIAAINYYLHIIHKEASERGYSFDARKFDPRSSHPKLRVTSGQIDYEAKHLRAKLRIRDPKNYRALKPVRSFEPHPLFRVVRGETEPWEKV